MLEILRLGLIPAVVNRHPIPVAQQNYIILWPDDGIKTIDFLLGMQNEIMQGLAGRFDFFVRDDVRCGSIIWIQMMCC